MAREEMTLSIDLEKVTWAHLIYVTGGGGFGGGPPDVQPYLWTTFFKVDGATVQLTEAGALDGSATVFTTPGGHGDLGWTSIHVGQSLGIPSDIGQWISDLRPIPVPLSLQGLLGTSDLPGIFGVVIVFMVDGGHIPDYAVEAGREALNTAIWSALNALIVQIGPFHQQLTQADIEAVTAGVGPAVHDAIVNSMGFWKKVWAYSGQDEEAGHLLLYWTQDDFPAGGGNKVMQAQAPMTSLGTWQVNGLIDLMKPCPADAVAAVLGALLGAEVNPPPAPSSGSPAPMSGMSRWSESLDSMRQFRNQGGIGRHPGLAFWWNVARDHTPECVRLTRQNSELRFVIDNLLTSVPTMLRDTSAPLKPDFIELIERLLTMIGTNAKSRLGPIALSLLPVARSLHGVTAEEGLRRLAISHASQSPADNG